jgi:RNA polymerase sigma-70 factor (ECF subfamily)
MSERNFSDIYSEFYPKITHYLTRLVGDSEAEDVAQIVFEKVSNNLFDFNLDLVFNKPTSPDQKIIRDEMSDCIREFVDRLPTDYRTVLILNELEGFTNNEIAEILQLSLDATKIRLHRARAKLKEQLKSGCDFYHDDRSELACDRKQPKNK